MGSVTTSKLYPNKSNNGGGAAAVLVVDDNKMNQFIVQRMLEKVP